MNLILFLNCGAEVPGEDEEKTVNLIVTGLTGKVAGDEVLKFIKQ